LSLLLISRQHGEKDWMKVMASTYRDHVVLCGLGHLGARILGQLVSAGVPVVALDRDGHGRFLAAANATGAPILIQDMRDDQALLEAGVAHARCIIIATNDDIANLEVALDARRFNPAIRVLMRLFDQRIADKIKGAFAIDEAFSSAALAAPVVAAMSQRHAVLASYPIAGRAHATAELVLAASGTLVGRTVGEVERTMAVRVLARVRDGVEAEAPLGAEVRLSAGDRLVVHVAADRMAALVAAAGR
jgi:Trk K+ transport system NAD-binding subunit